METIEEHYPNGQLKSRYTINEDGNKHGLYEDWYDNGQLWEKSNYTNGQLHGLCEIWYDNGQLFQKSSWENDKLHGQRERWDRDGKLMLRCDFKDGKIRGLWQTWNYDNTPRRTAYYIDDKKVSQEEWDAYERENGDEVRFSKAITNEELRMSSLMRSLKL